MRLYVDLDRLTVIEFKRYLRQQTQPLASYGYCVDLWVTPPGGPYWKCEQTGIWHVSSVQFTHRYVDTKNLRTFHVSLLDVPMIKIWR
jgi:hypothetical protein